MYICLFFYGVTVFFFLINAVTLNFLFFKESSKNGPLFPQNIKQHNYF